MSDILKERAPLATAYLVNVPPTSIVKIFLISHCLPKKIRLNNKSRRLALSIIFIELSRFLRTSFLYRENLRAILALYASLRYDDAARLFCLRDFKHYIKHYIFDNAL